MHFSTRGPWARQRLHMTSHASGLGQQRARAARWCSLPETRRSRMTPSADVTPFTGTYSADVDHSFVGFSVLHMGVSTFRGSFSDVSASVAVGHDGALKLHGSAQVQSVSIVSPPEFRNHVLGEDFFDAERHPAIVFESRPALPAEDGTITVEGSLTVRNVTRDIVATGAW